MRAGKGVPTSVSVKIPVPVQLAWQALYRILDAAEARPGSIELHVALPHALGTSAAVPVRLVTAAGNSRYEREITIEALDSKVFPQFRGVIAVVHTFANSCDLRLDGKYNPPLGAAGKIVDSTLLRDSARQSLERFMHSIAAQIEQLVKLPL